MKILIAPNAFKNSLDADRVAEAIEKGFMDSKLHCQCKRFPIGDGGDGTAKLILQQCKGSAVDVTVSDPLSRKIHTSFGLIDSGQTAIIEMADASGLRQLKQDELNPLKATSFGTGEQVKFALDMGVKKIVLGMGGSATVDGGAGILMALGIKFRDIDGNELTELPKDLIHLHSIDTAQLDPRLKNCEVIVLCDVDNVLLGNNGAAAMFGPQKGASVKDVQVLDKTLRVFADVCLNQTGKNISTIKYGGTAGGAAAGLHAFLNAKLVNGIEYFLSLTNFSKELEDADLVITGEGSIDEQTLQGKGPYGVAKFAKQKEKPVIGFAGKLPLCISEPLQQYFDVLVPISNEPSNLDDALKHTEINLIRTATAIGNLLALNSRI